MADPVAIGNEIASMTQQVQPAVEDYARTVETSAGAIQKADTDLVKMLQNQDAQQQTVVQDITGALDLQTRNEKFPAVVSNILGFFDSDWNNDVQNLKIKQAGVKLQAIDLERATAQAAHLAVKNAAEQDIRVKGAKVDAVTRTIGAKQTELQTGLAIKQEGRAAEMQPLQVEATKANTAATKQRTDITSENRKIETMSLADLNGLAGTGNALAQQEVSRRKSVQQGIKSMDLALEKGDIELLEYHKARFLKDQASSGMLEGLMEEAKQNNGVATHKTENGREIKFTMTELNTAKVAREETDRSVRQRDVAREQNVATIVPAAAQIQRIETAFAKENGGILPAGIAAQKTEWDARIKVAVASGDMETVAKTVQERNQALVNTVKDMTKDKPDTEKQAIENYYLRGAMDESDASSLVFAQGRNPVAGKNTPYALSTQLLAQSALDAGMSFSLDSAGGKGKDQNQMLSDMLSIGKKKDRDQILGQAISQRWKDVNGIPVKTNESGAGTYTVRDKYGQENFTLYATETLRQLAGTQVHEGGVPSFFKKYVDVSTGAIKEELFKDENGKFSTARIAFVLSKDTEALKKAGALPPTAENLADIYIRNLQLPQRQKMFTQHLQENFDMNQLAFSKLLFQNREYQVFPDYIQGMAAQAMAGKKVGQEQMQQVQQLNDMGLVLGAPPFTGTSEGAFGIQKPAQTPGAAAPSSTANPSSSSSSQETGGQNPVVDTILGFINGGVSTAAQTGNYIGEVWDALRLNKGDIPSPTDPRFEVKRK
jgi:hypothetical protein